MGFFILFCGLMIGVVVLGVQSMDWLRTGQWTDWTLSEALSQAGLDGPHTDWVEVQLALDWVAGLPMFALLPLPAIATGLALIASAELVLKRK